MTRTLPTKRRVKRTLRNAWRKTFIVYRSKFRSARVFCVFRARGRFCEVKAAIYPKKHRHISCGLLGFSSKEKKIVLGTFFMTGTTYYFSLVLFLSSSSSSCSSYSYHHHQHHSSFESIALVRVTHSRQWGSSSLLFSASFYHRSCGE